MRLSIKEQFTIIQLKEKLKYAASENDAALCFELGEEIDQIELGSLDDSRDVFEEQKAQRETADFWRKHKAAQSAKS